MELERFALDSGQAANMAAGRAGGILHRNFDE